MFNQKSILGIIPARSGSKRLPNKNLKAFGGSSLIELSFQSAKESKFIDKLIISTDSKEMSEAAKKYGLEVPFIRPDELSVDSASSESVVLHSLEYYKNNFDYVLLLQPTSPFRTTDDIDLSISHCIQGNFDSLTSVYKNKFSSEYIFTKKNGSAVNLSAAKGLDAFHPNGAIYISSVDSFLNNKSFYSDNMCLYEMSFEFSDDIDTLLDFQVAEYKFINKEENG